MTIYRLYGVVSDLSNSTRGLPNLDVEIWEDGASWPTPRQIVRTNTGGGYFAQLDDTIFTAKPPRLLLRVYQSGSLLQDLHATPPWSPQSVEAKVDITAAPLGDGGGCCPNYLIRGRVFDPNGQPSDAVPGAVVELWENGGAWTALRTEVVTDEDGNFSAELPGHDLASDPPVIYFKISRGVLNPIDTKATPSLTWNPSKRNVSFALSAKRVAAWTRVEGRVLAPDGTPQVGCTVSVFPAEIRDVAASIGTSAPTDANGRFTVDCNYKATAKLDITVRAFAPSVGPEIARSPVLVNVGASTYVDLVTGNGNYVGPSEYTQVLEAVTDAIQTYGSQVTPPPSPPSHPRDLTSADVVQIATKYGWSADLVQLLVDADKTADVMAKMINGVNLSATLFYGLGRRNRRSSDPTAPMISAQMALGMRKDECATIIAEEIRANILPQSFQSAAAIELTSLDNARGLMLLQTRINDSWQSPFLPTRLSVILSISGLTPAEQGTLLSSYIAYAGTPEEFWSKAPDLTGFAVTKLDAARRALELGVYTLNHPPLVRLLWDKGYGAPAGASPRLPMASLAQIKKSGTGGWLDFMNTPVNTLPAWSAVQVDSPDEIVGADQSTRRSNYADVIMTVVQTAFPTGAISTALALPDATLLKTFLQNNQDFEFASSSVSAYERASGITLDAATRAQAERMARLFRLAPDDNRYAVASALWSAGFDSARGIYLVGRDAFLRTMTAAPYSLSEDVARGVYHKASQVHGTAVAIATQYGPAFGFPGSGGAIANPSPDGGAGFRAFSATSSLPDWEALFGSLDYCACEDCQSVFSAGAYLADILQFVAQRPTQRAGTTTPAFTALTTRRGDLTKVLLSCTNTNTALPQIDLVNEVLEIKVAKPAQPPVYQTTWAAEDLALHPENLLSSAYDVLMAAAYPWSLPYNLPIDETRSYLAQVGLSRADISAAFARDVYNDITTQMEWGGLTFYQRDLCIGGRASFQPPEYWGYPATSTTWVADLKSFPTFLRASKLLPDDAIAVLATAFVRREPLPTPHDVDLSVTFDPDDPCNLDNATIPNLDANALDRIHRFERLRRILGWTPRQLDRLMFQFSIDLTIPRATFVKETASRLGVSIDDVIAWRVGGPDRFVDPTTGTSEYAEIFQSKTVSASSATNIFKLAGNELADTSRDLTKSYVELAAGLGTDVESVKAILAYANPSATKLTLGSIILLYQYVTLARALRISVATLIVMLKLTGRQPFDPYKFMDPIRLKEDLDRANAFQFNPDELHYILRHKDTADGAYRPKDTAIAQALTDLRDAVGKVVNSAPPDQDPQALITSKEGAVIERFAAMFGTTAGVMSGILRTHVHARVAGGAVDTKLAIELLRDIDLVSGAISSASAPQYFATYLAVHKAATIAVSLNLNEVDVSWALNTGPVKIDALPVDPSQSAAAGVFDGWFSLVDAARLRDSFVDGNVLDLLDAAARFAGTDTGNVQRAALLAEVAKRTGWSATDLTSLMGTFDFNLVYPTDFKDGQGLVRIKRAIEIASKLGLSATAVAPWNQIGGVLVDTPVGNPSDGPKPARDMALAVKTAVRGRFDDAAWRTAGKEARHGIRERQRDALVAYLVNHTFDVDGVTPIYADESALSDDLLTDVLVGACAQTSRVKHAISAVQTFVQRILLDFEGYQLSPTDAVPWAWMKNYRLWEANQRIFVYPENWIEPELRSDKTPLFKALESDLAKQDLTTDGAEEAVFKYLEGLDEIANLEVVASAQEVDPDTGATKFHVVGRTRSVPHVYYYRALVEDRYWTPWEKIELDIQSDHLLVGVFNRRVYLIWGVLTEATGQGDPSTDSPNAPARRYELRLRWSSLRNGKWSAAQQSKDFLPSSFNGKDSLRLKEYVLDPNKMNDEISASERVELAAQKLSIHFRPDDDDLLVTIVNAHTPNPAYGKSLVDHVDSALKIDSTVGYVAARWRQRFRLTGGRGIVVGESTLGEVTTSYVDVVQNAIPKRLFPRAQWFSLEPGANGFALLDVYSARSWTPPRSTTEMELLAHTPTPYDVLPTGADGDAWAYEPLFFQDGARSFFVTSLNARWVPTTVPSSTARTTMPPPDTTKHTASRFVQANANLLNIATVTVTDAKQWASSLYSVLTPAVKTWNETKVVFSPFYHPFTREVMTHLNRYGVDGFYDPQPGKPGLPTRQSLDRDYFKETYNPQGGVCEPYPTEDFDFDYGGAYSQYNWELFFHVPLLVATKLMNQQKFEDARKWFHYIFNPTQQPDPVVNEPSPQRFWKVKPFFQLSSPDIAVEGSALAQLDLLLSYDDGDPERIKMRKAIHDQVAEWRQDPFDPHAIARLRPVAYMKNVVMKYLDMLIGWGDQLFARNTIESINEAIQLYVTASRVLGRRPAKLPTLPSDDKSYEGIVTTLDKFSQAVVQIEATIPPVQGSDLAAAPSADDVMVYGRSLAFCTPFNDKLTGYWDTVDDRLFKIRHCMNLEGVAQQLPLFEPPIDPGLLVKARAAGIDLSSIIGDVTAPLPYQRYAVLAQRASELMSEVKSLGGALLSALEKKDAEALARLRAEQEITLLKAVRESKQQAIEEVNRAIEALGAQAEATQKRIKYYQSRQRMNDSESAQYDATGDAGNLRKRMQEKQMNAGALAMIPTLSVGTGGLSSPVSLFNFGGSFLAAVAQIDASSTGAEASSVEADGQQAGLTGGFARRMDEWQFQLNLANSEAAQIDKQTLAAQVRLKIAQMDLANHDIQTTNAQDVRDFMRDKYTNEQLYDWMLGQVSAVYFQSYKLAYEMAKRAERAWQFELADTTSFVSFGYWDSLRKGLLAGERLGLDLKRMEAAYLAKNVREYELTRHVPLTMLNPMALQRLREEGTCDVFIPEAYFDLDSPGHYLRRIKHVSLTISGVTGPYTSVRCKLTLNASSVRATPDVNAALSSSNVPVQSIVTSSGREDGGLFETNLRDERYLPFEGAGAISSWTLELPTTLPSFDYRTISDVILHMAYTARDGGNAFRKDVIDGKNPYKGLISAVNVMPVTSDGSTTGPYIGLSIKSAFADAWFRFLAGDGSAPALTLDLDREHLNVPVGATIREVRVVLVGATTTPSWTPPLRLTITTPLGSNSGTLDLTSSPDVLNGQPTDSSPYSTPAQLGSWTIACGADTANQRLSDLGRIRAAQDLYIIVGYKVS